MIMTTDDVFVTASFLRNIGLHAKKFPKETSMNEIVSINAPSCRVGVFEVYPDRNLIEKDNEGFSLEPRVMDVFSVLIEAAGDVVSREVLITKNWDMVHGADESLTRVISILRRTLRQAGETDEYIQTISKRGYRLIQPVQWHKIQSPSSVGTATDYTSGLDTFEAPSELSEIAHEAGSNLMPDAQTASPRKSILGALVFGMIIILAGLFLLLKTPSQNNDVDRTVIKPENLQTSSQIRTDINPASIAVLPFVDLSPSGDQMYFSDGISEEILNVLSQIDGLKVASRTSSFQFKNKTSVGIPAIGNELSVRHILQGSVRKAGDSIRITTQLIDAESDQHLWSSTYNRTLSTENLFLIQEEIAHAIVEAIQKRIDDTIGETPSIVVKTGSVDAYASFLKARTLYQNRTSFDESERILAQAAALDPDFADVWALRATLYTIAFAYGSPYTESATNDRVLARTFAQKSLSIKSDNGLALATLALADMIDLQEGIGDKSFTEIMAGFENALAVETKNVDALNWRGVQMQRAGFMNQAVVDHSRCLEIDQLYMPCRYNLMSGLAVLGRGDETLEQMYQALEYGALGNDTLMLLILAEIERRDLFLVAAGWHPHLHGWNRFGDLYEALQTPSEDHTELRTQLQDTLERNGAKNITSDLLLAALGDHSAYTTGAVYWFDTHVSFRKRPEFKEHIKSMGIYDFWKATDFPPQCRPINDDDFECA